MAQAEISVRVWWWGQESITKQKRQLPHIVTATYGIILTDGSASSCWSWSTVGSTDLPCVPCVSSRMPASTCMYCCWLQYAVSLIMVLYNKGTSAHQGKHNHEGPGKSTQRTAHTYTPTCTTTRRNRQGKTPGQWVSCSESSFHRLRICRIWPACLPTLVAPDGGWETSGKTTDTGRTAPAVGTHTRRPGTETQSCAWRGFGSHNSRTTCRARAG